MNEAARSNPDVQSSPALLLVTDLIFHVHGHCSDARQLFRSREVCQEWRRSIDAPEQSELWRGLLVKRCGLRRHVALPSQLPTTTWRAAYLLALGPIVTFGSLVTDNGRHFSTEQLDEMLQWLVRLADLAATEARCPFGHLFGIDARGWTYAAVFKSGKRKGGLGGGGSDLQAHVQEWWRPAVMALTERVRASVNDAPLEARSAACRSVRSFVHLMSSVVMRWGCSGAGSSTAEWMAQSVRDAEPACVALERMAQ
ncbi:hypothetical protein EMIHUDRAFT_226857 [Emiliania huxleyi CCMP1516]|uniref:F-box domain-containing protein n=2 Tax=Emiliania huxleyi TaxID=2903 RepID=A0A0D3KJT6_EMIH1|nr:hypothetical protein EMIHUDRAFT_226857 [Emiliania huxleyi CCMP1516]EOD36021.1 hypothetical protein EMIHUDRAFT_226857 [Emiliania huxleyi CCMP1516]|eukprot:XP_005788450.1 hypothetical protein EMIHUDRAFT_226857 [Emiliania huxleyi CCMP1516]